MNIYDIAQRAGVSIATVSRVMNGNSHVSDATRKRVLTVIEELGFTPSVHARSLGKGSMKTIGVLCADASDLFLAQAVNHIEGMLRLEGYNALLCCTGHALENKRRAIKLLLGKQVDALLLVGSQFQEAEDNRHILQAARQVPVVLINGTLHSGNLACVRLDHRQAIYRATQKLIRQGRKVLYLHDSLTHSGREKLEGYQQAIDEAGGEPLLSCAAPERWIRPGLCPAGCCRPWGAGRSAWWPRKIFGDWRLKGGKRGGIFGARPGFPDRV